MHVVEKLSNKNKIITVDAYKSYPEEEILKKSKGLDCDLIILGSNQRGLTHTFLGSVAKSVLRRSRIPTLIVPLPQNLDKLST